MPNLLTTDQMLAELTEFLLEIAEQHPAMLAFDNDEQTRFVKRLIHARIKSDVDLHYSINMSHMPPEERDLSEVNFGIVADVADYTAREVLRALIADNSGVLVTSVGEECPSA